MSIRFLKITTCYSSYLEKFQNKSPHLQASSYYEILYEFLKDGFGSADFWKKNLEKTGEFTCEEIIFNYKKLQVKWAEENKVQFDEANWAIEIVQEQISAFKPEVIFLEDHSMLNPEEIKCIRKNNPCIKKIIGWDGLWMNDLKIFSEFDIILSCVEECASFYTQNGLVGFFFPFGFETSLWERMPSISRTYDMTFIGSLILEKGFHNKRAEILYHLVKNSKIDLWLSGLAQSKKYQVKRLLNGNFKEFAYVSKISGHNHGEAYGIDMFKILGQSNLTLNIHIDASRNKAGNMRLFEATGMGACVLTDEKENLSDFFIPDVEVVTFKDKFDCLEKVQWLQRHPDERNRIAAAGQKRTFTDYSMEKRINIFASAIKNLL
jgi:spore maturation protein CgeB